MLSQSQIDIIIQSMMPYNPLKIGIFGSVARGEDTPDSDIDILYRFKNVIGMLSLIRMKEDIETRLNTKIDLVDEEFVHPGMKPYVMNDLKIIYSDE